MRDDTMTDHMATHRNTQRMISQALLVPRVVPVTLPLLQVGIGGRITTISPDEVTLGHLFREERSRARLGLTPTIWRRTGK